MALMAAPTAIELAMIYTADKLKLSQKDAAKRLASVLGWHKANKVWPDGF